jgi:predicted hotdog family 3-hydroxylacyl-ACP dehydratase/3-hydroxymyristoyl/3-hydroxydecanoyl-(acyl carrier protein) dehydratase
MRAVSQQPMSGIRREPRIETVERDAAALRVEARVPADLAFFEGHFPGSPVLPGFVQLQWVAELARQRLDVDPLWTRIEALKFREPLLPGDAFSLRVDVERTDGEVGLRFALRRAARPISEGRLRGRVAGDGEPRERATRVATRPPADSGGATAPLRIPQQGAMRLLTRVLAHRGDVTLCEARIGDAHPSLRSGRAPVWLALELLAQGMAAQGGLALGDAMARRAFVVGARRILLDTGDLPAGETLWVRAQHARGETGLVMCDCAMGRGEPPDSAEQALARSLAQGRLMAFVEPDPGAAASATSSA